MSTVTWMSGGCPHTAVCSARCRPWPAYDTRPRTAASAGNTLPCQTQAWCCPSHPSLHTAVCSWKYAEMIWWVDYENYAYTSKIQSICIICIRLNDFTHGMYYTTIDWWWGQHMICWTWRQNDARGRRQHFVWRSNISYVARIPSQ